jgi:hypothetical protein
VLPRWLAVAFGSWPLLEVVGYGSGIKAIAIVGYFLQFAALALCAASLTSARRPAGAMRPSSAPAIS